MRKLTKENFGSWAVITGASSGIGMEMAKIVAKIGINIVLVARDEDRLKLVQKDIEKNFNVKTKVVITNLSNNIEIENLIKQCEDLDVGLLVNSAGYAISGEFLNNSLDNELDMVSVNINAPLVLSHYFGNKMKDKRKGGIIFLSSIMAFAGASDWANYNATKAYNLLLAEGLAQELKQYNIKVLALTPGSTISGFQNRSNTKSAVGAMSAKRVAKLGLWMLGCKRTYAPGLINKLIVLSTRINPRIINSYIFSAVVNKLKY